MKRAAPLLLLVLSACAADCTTSDWQARGYRDGYDGHPTQDLRLLRYCGTQVSQSDYLKGYAVGHDEHIRLKTMNCD